MYFNECSTYQEAKKLFSILCFKHHPDHNGNEETFKAILHEFENFTCDDAKQQSKEDLSNFAQAIQALSFLDGIQISIVGSWIWIAGNTKEHKESIKKFADDFNFKYKWNFKRNIWQLSPANEKYRKFKNELHTKESLQAFYGGKDIEQDRQRKRSLQMA